MLDICREPANAPGNQPHLNFEVTVAKNVLKKIQKLKCFVALYICLLRDLQKRLL